MTKTRRKKNPSKHASGLRSTTKPLLRPYFLRPTLTVARDLLGAVLSTKVGGVVTSGMIVETEAYLDTDPASHSYRGVTPRTEVMFRQGGYCYVYLIYGLHYCVNVVTEEEGRGAAVLIRAIEPLLGIEEMEQRRAMPRGVNLTRGPARLCEALGIDRTFNGEDLVGSKKIWLESYQRVPDSLVATSPRIGISKSVDLPWRFFVKDNPWVS